MNSTDLAVTPETRTVIVHALHWIAMVIELIGVAIIVGAAAASTLRFIRTGVATTWNAGFHQYRANLGRGILLGLEFLVAADIIGTVAVTPSFQSLGILGLIIAIRTFLSLSLEIEIEGRWPWRRQSQQGHEELGPSL
ncbi:MAG: DUF1622 domain-containing protein [Rhodospirillales bacterium]|nr:DUF1622 domain-containing protein [Rhodospirillales bacterium]